MELRQLKYFAEVAKRKSFSSAAKALFISQGTLSQQIRQLEDELGVTLLERDSRHVELSDYGEVFLEDALKVIGDSEVCLQRIKDVAALQWGSVEIGATYSFCPLLKETVASFLGDHPSIECNVHCATVPELMKKLREGELDVVLCYKPSQDDPDVEAHTLFSTDLCLIVGREHPLYGRESVTLSELTPYRFILPSKGVQARSVLDSILARKDLTLNVCAQMSYPHLIFDMLAGSRLATLMPRATVSGMGYLKAIPLEGTDARMEASYLRRRKSYRKRAVEDFLSRMLENNSMSLAMENISK